MSPPTASRKLSTDNVQSSSSSSSNFLDIATKRIYDDLIESICSNIIASELHQRIKNGEIPVGDLSYNRQQLYPTIYNRTDDNNDETSHVVSDSEVRIELDKYAVYVPLSSGSNSIVNDKRKINNDSFIDVEEKITMSVDKFENKSNERKLTGSVNTTRQSPSGSLVPNEETKGTGGGLRESSLSTTSGGVSTRQQSSSSLITQQQQQLVDIWGNIPLKEPKELLICPVCHRSINTLRFAPHLEKCMGIHYASGFVDDDDDDTDIDETE